MVDQTQNETTGRDVLAAWRQQDAEMRYTNIEAIFLEEIGAVLDLDPDFIDPEDTMPGLGLDSLKLVGLASKLQERFGLAIPANVLPITAPLSEISALMAEALGAEDPIGLLRRKHSERIASVIHQDIYLLEGTAVRESRVKPAEAAEPSRVFLTGATGFIGAYLVRELISRTKATIHCLVRAEDTEAGYRRLEDNLTRFDLPSTGLRERVVIEAGDLASAQFGLSDARYAELCEAVDIVYHNGASVHLTQTYEEMRGPNVDGTRTILHLAGHQRAKPVVVISTVGLLDTRELSEKPVITETDSPTDPGLLPNGYTQTKWAGEKMVDLAQEAGVQAVNLRVGHVIGHGVSQDLAGRLAQACLRALAAPDLQKPVDYVPPEYVAAAIVEVPRRLLNLTGIYHLTNPNPVTPDELKAMVPFSPAPVEVLAMDKWLARIRVDAATDPTHPMFSALDALGDPDRPTEVSFVEQVLSRPQVACERTVKALAGTGVTCPPASHVFANVLIGMPELSEAFSDIDAIRAMIDQLLPNTAAAPAMSLSK